MPFHRLISSNNKNEPSLDLIEKGQHTMFIMDVLVKQALSQSRYCLKGDFFFRKAEHFNCYQVVAEHCFRQGIYRQIWKLDKCTSIRQGTVVTARTLLKLFSQKELEINLCGRKYLSRKGASPLSELLIFLVSSIIFPFWTSSYFAVQGRV